MIIDTSVTVRRRGVGSSRSLPRPLRALVPGVAAVLFAGVQLQAGIVTVAYGTVTMVPEDRLNFPYEGAKSVALSSSWAVAQGLFVLSLLGFARSGATGRSRPGQLAAKVMVVGGVVFVGAQCLSAFLPLASSAEPAAGVAVLLFALGSVATALGFVLAGVVVLRARRWSSWRRFTPLSVGVAMLVLVPLQFTSLLALGVTVYAATIAAFGTALLVEPPESPT